MNESEDDQLDVGTLDPLNQVNVVEDLNNKKDVIIRNCNVDQTLLNAITLVDRKLTRLTLVAAIGNKHTSLLGAINVNVAILITVCQNPKSNIL